jgi:DNA adenine methylase
MAEKRLRPPLTYYGGKQTLAPLIISLIPPHTLYAEPFIGGGAIFFMKSPSKVEVLNDTNGELMNFYRVMQAKFRKLQIEITRTPHSRDAHRKAKVIYTNPDMFDEVKRAWAVWVLCAQGFAAKMDGPWGFDKADNTTSKRVANKRDNFQAHYLNRLRLVQIENADALYIIQSRDTKDSFFYCDPPYFNSNMGHYKGYTEADFEALLRLLSQIKGKFLLSSYPSTILDKYIKKCKWHSRTIEKYVTVNAKLGNQKKKTEVLTANYAIAENGEALN